VSYFAHLQTSASEAFGQVLDVNTVVTGCCVEGWTERGEILGILAGTIPQAIHLVPTDS